MVFRYKSDVNGLRIGLPFFEPEKMAFANAKTFQVWVSVFAFVVWKGCDPKWLQSLGIESDGTLEVTDCENNVVYHIFLSVFVGIDLNERWAGGPPFRNFLVDRRARVNDSTPVRYRRGMGLAFPGGRPFRF